MVAAALQLCFQMPSYIWWFCVILVVIAGLFNITHSGVVLPTAPFMIWCLVYTLYRCVALFWTIDLGVTISSLLHFLFILLFFFSSLQLLSKKNAIKNIGILSAVISVVLFIFLLFLLVSYTIKLGYDSGKHFKYIMYLNHGIHIHMVIFAYGVMTILALLGCINWLAGKRILIHIFFALVVPMIFVFMLGARNVLLLQLIFCGSLVIIHLFKIHRWVFALNMVATAVIFVALVAMEDGLLPKHLTEQTTNRDQLWTMSYKAAMEVPLTGFGYGTARKVLGQSTSSEQVGAVADFSGGSHSIFFDALVEGGWLGFGLVLAFFFIVVLDSGGIRAGVAGNILLALLVGLWARGFVEVGGLFGTGNGVGDYLSWLCVAAYYVSSKNWLRCRQKS